jgi:hypothetical protein
MLRLHTFEQRGYSFVVRVIQRNGDTVASTLSDEIGSFAYRAAIERVTVRHAASGDIYGCSRLAQGDCNPLSRASTRSSYYCYQIHIASLSSLDKFLGQTLIPHLDSFVRLRLNGVQAKVDLPS